jgi:hypothetical protein
MFRKQMFRVLAVVSLGLGSLSTACGVEADKGEEVAATGTLELPLVAVEGDKVYRVTGLALFLSGSTTTWLYGSNDPSETVVSTALPTGDYIAHVYSGYLERADTNGNFVPVQARLVSSSHAFKIHNGATSTLAIAFETDGVIVTVGAGDLRVVLDVTEGAAVCTPFGGGCQLGTWCPPTGLTGAPRACVAEGVLGVGEPCSSPSECVANASCFDLGSGAVCAELCPGANAGQTCSFGGICRGVDSEYGVCRPEPAL